MMTQPTPSVPTEQDKATAYHEAGHAVMALYLDRPVHKVNILPQGERLGVCVFRKGVQRPSDDWLETEMLIALAGLAAEAHYTGRYDFGGAARDLMSARKLALMRTSERSVERYERRMLAKTEHTLADEQLWLAVVNIAEELLKRGTISGRAARHFYEEAMKGE